MRSVSDHPDTQPPARPDTQPPARPDTQPPARPTTPGELAGPARPRGLRERKKARTRAAIRKHAVRLFKEQGYHATTVEQIAEAAEVSPSTFFRYFPTKEDVVLQDDFDVLALEAFQAQPPGLGPVAALRAAMRAVFAELSADDLEQFRETASLSIAVPEIRARAFDEFAHAIQTIAEAMAKRAGRGPDDFAVRNLAGAVVGVVMSATLAAAQDPAGDMLEAIDAALAHLGAGLPL